MTLAIAASLGLAAFFGFACTDAPQGTSLLLITIDTLRADHVSAYGYSRQTTPSIDRLASEGVLWQNAIAPRSETWPSLTSVLTSRHPQAHGVRSNGDVRREEIRTMAEHLHDAGFSTAAFLTNMTTAVHPGFEHVEKWGVEAWAEGGHHGVDVLAVEAARAWIDDHAGERFFVWVHLIGPHDPYETPPGGTRRFSTGYAGERDGSRRGLWIVHHQRVELSEAELAHIVSLYDDDVADADESVGMLLQEIEDQGLRDHTVVAVNGDHGEELYDHGFYFFHSWSIHDSGLRVPLVLRLPGRLPAGRELEGVVENLDIAPTLFALLDLDIPDAFEGRNLVPDVSAPDAGARPARSALSELGPGIFSLRTQRWRYIHNPERYSSPGGRERDTGHRGFFQVRDGQLYDIQADPLEQHDVAAEHPEVVDALRAQLLARIRAPGNAPSAPIEPETERELRALGYLQDLEDREDLGQPDESAAGSPR